ncbi:hypothetical protein ASPSYDRAFT_999363 [Aspergillus sydowii CBS 593.65]|uniref:Uncharacterized protein n=1 Tax=Aspergillus sydowii CBS 593.65 TaxID=1036612 RepID=A0A1L9TI54_9EURO|nr:uncharacterized protein ASPSYDRAFT_999363 [Aspergillus sydowii CBS 593.65]OJJ59114.1 hypothetical protein ASPSYDRAFT_999363 [Aspergillus sydowii CBS 593.65]
MHASILTLALTALAIPGSTAFVVDSYESDDCSGPVKDEGVNVYDNTCADWPGWYQSVRVRALSYGPRQHAYFCHLDCGPECRSWWANGDSPEFQVGKCIGLGDITGESMGSFAV